MKTDYLTVIFILTLILTLILAGFGYMAGDWDNDIIVDDENDLAEIYVLNEDNGNVEKVNVSDSYFYGEASA